MAVAIWQKIMSAIASQSTTLVNVLIRNYRVRLELKCNEDWKFIKILQLNQIYLNINNWKKYLTNLWYDHFIYLRVARPIVWLTQSMRRSHTETLWWPTFIAGSNGHNKQSIFDNYFFAFRLKKQETFWLIFGKDD